MKKSIIIIIGSCIICLTTVGESKSQNLWIQMQEQQFVTYLINVNSSQNRDCVVQLLDCLGVGADINNKSTQERIVHLHVKARLSKNTSGWVGNPMVVRAIDCLDQFDVCITGGVITP